MTESITVSLGGGKDEALIQAAKILGFPVETPRSVINWFCELVKENPKITLRLRGEWREIALQSPTTRKHDLTDKFKSLQGVEIAKEEP